MMPDCFDCGEYKRLLKAMKDRAEAAEAESRRKVEYAAEWIHAAEARVERLEAALRGCLSVLPHGLPGSKYDNAKAAALVALRGEDLDGHIAACGNGGSDPDDCSPACAALRGDEVSAQTEAGSHTSPGLTPARDSVAPAVPDTGRSACDGDHGTWRCTCMDEHPEPDSNGGPWCSFCEHMHGPAHRGGEQ
jgi:hypothetical protein